jgi:hypothetical protein
MRHLLVLTIAAMLAACGSDVAPKTGGPVAINSGNSGNNTVDGGSANNVTNPDTGPDDVPDATMSSQDAPSIIDLVASPARLSEGDGTLVSAIVTDPQGTEDIVAGRLLDGQNQDLIGNFRNIGGGSFELEVTWDQLHGVRPIGFGPAGTQRAVTAEFIDNANERSTRSLTLSLDCEGESACDGECGLETCNGECLDPRFDYETAENCGECGNACGAGQSCSDSMCVDGGGLNGECFESADCIDAEAFCATEAEFGLPGGACLVTCGSSDGCPGSAECVNFEAPELPPISLCAIPCATGATCRPGWGCTELVTTEDTVVNVCAPTGL